MQAIRGIHAGVENLRHSPKVNRYPFGRLFYTFFVSAPAGLPALPASATPPNAFSPRYGTSLLLFGVITRLRSALGVFSLCVTVGVSWGSSPLPRRWIVGDTPSCQLQAVFSVPFFPVSQRHRDALSSARMSAPSSPRSRAQPFPESYPFAPIPISDLALLGGCARVLR